MIIYKIRTKDGLFSTGGRRWRLSFSKTGKIWKRKSDLTLHLSGLSNENRQEYFDREACVVEYEVTERPVSTQTVSEYLAERNKIKLEIQENAKIGRERHAKELRRRQYEDLKREFEE